MKKHNYTIKPKSVGEKPTTRERMAKLSKTEKRLNKRLAGGSDNLSLPMGDLATGGWRTMPIIYE